MTDALVQNSYGLGITRSIAILFPSLHTFNYVAIRLVIKKYLEGSDSKRL